MIIAALVVWTFSFFFRLPYADYIGDHLVQLDENIGQIEFNLDHIDEMDWKEYRGLEKRRLFLEDRALKAVREKLRTLV